MKRKYALKQDMLKVFETVPDLYLILSEDLYILNASNAYLKATRTVREDIINKNLFDVFPGNTDTHHANSIKRLSDSLQKVLETRNVHKLEIQRYDILLKNDDRELYEKKYWNIVNSPVTDDQGNLSYIIHKITDITEEVGSHEHIQDLVHREHFAIEKVRKLYRRMFDFFLHAPFAIAIYDGPNHVIQLINPIMSKLVGLSSDELINKPLLEIAPEFVDQGVGKILDDVYLNGATHDYKEKAFYFKVKGKLYEGYYNSKFQPLRDENGNIVGVLNIVHDVTDEILRRKTIEKSERQLRLITDSIPVLISYLDKDEKYRFANLAYKSWFNQNPQNLLGRHVKEIVGDKAYQGVKKYIDRALSGEQLVFEARMPYRENFVKYIRTSYVPDIKDGKVQGFFALVNDITDQHESKVKLEASELKFRSLLETIPQNTWTNLPDGEVNFFNQGWYDYTGLNFEESKSWGWKKAIHPDDIKPYLQVYKRSLESGEVYTFENRIKHAETGIYRWHLNRSVPIRDEEGNISIWVGTATDIHEKKLLEQKLLESERYFRMMADNVPVMIWVTQPNGQLTYLNKLWYDYTGQNESTGLGDGWLDVVHPADVENTQKEMGRALSKHKPFDIIYRIKRKDGNFRWILDIAWPRYNAEEEFEGFVGAVVDIHERKIAEESLHHLSNELSMANEELQSANDTIFSSNEELARSNQQLSFINADMDNFIYTASHDLRAPISNIEGLMDALKRNLSKESSETPVIQKVLKMINSSIERFKNTLSDLTQITKLQREDTDQISKVNLSQIIEEVKLDLANQIEEADAQFEMDLQNCSQIEFSTKNVRSIIYNLISNAIKYRKLNEQVRIEISCKSTVDFHILTISDNGLGMDLSDQNKIFAMFKRLHDHVEGTGIGLYIVKKIIDNAGGRIEVESQIGVGTSFKVYFKK